MYQLGCINKQKFSFLDFTALAERQHAILCTECKTHLFATGETKKNDRNGRTVWPAFLWSVLRRPSLAVRCWSFLPCNWKKRWGPRMVLGDVVEDSSLFDDITTSTGQDLAALTSLKWTDLMDREESLALPTVKCPAGCSEWKHKALNNLPMDIVFEHFLGAELWLYSSNHFANAAIFSVTII